MKNLKGKETTTEQEAKDYFETQEPLDDIMQYLDMDEVIKGIEKAEREIANGEGIEFREAFRMLRKEVLGEFSIIVAPSFDIMLTEVLYRNKYYSNSYTNNILNKIYVAISVLETFPYATPSVKFKHKTW